MRILQKNHVINGATEYFRQRRLNPYGSTEFEANNAVMDWTSIRYLLGEYWKGHKLGELNKRYKNYYSPLFLTEFEFVEFEGQWEKYSTIVSSFEQMKDINSGMVDRRSIFMSWGDWPKFLVNEVSNKQRELYKNGCFDDDLDDRSKKMIIDAIKEYEEVLLF